MTLPKIRWSLTRPQAPALRRLYAYAWWTQKRKAAEISAILRHSDLTVTAWHGKQVLAFARVSTDFTARAVIWDVIVHPEFQGQGLGRSAIQKIVRHPRLKKVQGFWLYTTDKQPFYKRLGFKPYPRNLFVLKRGHPRPSKARR